MLNNISQMLDIGLQYIATNPGKAALSFFTLQPVRSVLVNTLTEDQLEWLSYDIQTRPTGFVEFLGSAAGRQEIAKIFASYQSAVRLANRRPSEIQLAVSRPQQQA